MNNFTGNMRPGQKNRGRGGRGMGGGGFNPNRQGGGGGGRPQHRNQNFDSSGPSVKIRGNAYQVFERYIAMAREAASAGDRIAAENLYQHAEHYYRIMQANGEGQQQQQRPMTPADTEMAPHDEVGEPGAPQPGMQPQPQPQYQPQQHQPPQHQPQQQQPQRPPQTPHQAPVPQQSGPAQNPPQPQSPPSETEY